MRKHEIIKDLEENIYCRIQRSRVHGVGVFAVRDISKGVNPLLTYTEVPVVAIPENEIMENKKIPNGVKAMIKDFYAVRNGKIYCDARSFNEINITYFLNHSKKPNLVAREIDQETIFTAKRDIRQGEELTTNYDTYSDWHKGQRIKK